MAVPMDQPLIIGGVEEEEITIHIMRDPGQGLGISIAGGLGSTPYKGEDEVRLVYRRGVVVCVGVCRGVCVWVCVCGEVG